MAGAKPMPRTMLDALAGHAAGAILFDMVTTPEATEFLAVGTLQGARTIDGLSDARRTGRARLCSVFWRSCSKAGSKAA